MNKEVGILLGAIAGMCDGPYSGFMGIPKGTNQNRQARKYRTYGSHSCNTCGKHNVTLVKIGDTRYCRDCAKEAFAKSKAGQMLSAMNTLLGGGRY